jgi:hypothetical protein
LRRRNPFFDRARGLHGGGYSRHSDWGMLVVSVRGIAGEHTGKGELTLQLFGGSQLHLAACLLEEGSSLSLAPWVRPSCLGLRRKHCQLLSSRPLPLPCRQDLVVFLQRYLPFPCHRRQGLYYGFRRSCLQKWEGGA